MSWIAPPTEPFQSFQSESVNRADFQYKQGERQQPIRPKNEIERAEGPFNGESSSRDAYKAWQAQPRYRHQQPAYERPEGSMDLRTTYSNEFANSGPRVRLPPIRPESQHRQLRDPNAAFAGHSEQTESFPGYKRAQISDAKPASFKPNRQYQPPEVPFAARSSYAGDFATTAPGSERARPVRHSDQLQMSTEPMVNRGAGSNAEYGAAAGVGGAVAAKRQPIVPRGSSASLLVPSQPRPPRGATSHRRQAGSSPGGNQFDTPVSCSSTQAQRSLFPPALSPSRTSKRGVASGRHP
ncbi:hypothetical protein BOX15_Mlig016642g3 [Macrostomum lignano]|uniref:Uncharacterized protein n=1 Tax=Macrostomum lignano TaxID=282301 RepID=A0A267GA13_9PLAT|nr:hypothetical protein BOX15_Mlig016642g3 [Macrostomum lignano]